jgi:hypothetical protein
MKVTSDRIKARAQQLRNNGFRLSGSMVRSTLELNAGARTLQPSLTATAPEKTKKEANEPDNAEAA